MARAQDGDREAYRRCSRKLPYLRFLATRRVPNRSDVEDAVQDALVTIHAVRHTYDPARPFGPWLVAIANRRIVDGCGDAGEPARARRRSTPSMKPLQRLNEYHEAASERAHCGKRWSACLRGSARRSGC